MKARPQIVGDLTQHLTEEMLKVLVRHLAIMDAGGCSTLEATAAVLCTAEQIALKAAGVAIAGTRPERRHEMFVATIDKLRNSMLAAAPKVIAGIAAAETAARGDVGR